MRWLGSEHTDWLWNQLRDLRIIQCVFITVVWLAKVVEWVCCAVLDRSTAIIALRHLLAGVVNCRCYLATIRL